MSCNALAFPTFVTISLQELLVLEADSTASRIFSELGVCWLFEVLSEPQYAKLLHRFAEHEEMTLSHEEMTLSHEEMTSHEEMILSHEEMTLSHEEMTLIATKN